MSTIHTCKWYGPLGSATKAKMWQCTDVLAMMRAKPKGPGHGHGIVQKAMLIVASYTIETTQHIALHDGRLAWLGQYKEGCRYVQ
jgi:hypothetical protein